MKIVKAGYEILDELDGQAILKKIERVARVCYKSEDRIADGSAERMVRSLIKSGHDAMLEHYSFSVKFTVDRGVSHEIVRHRIASYSQESTRYVSYSDKPYRIDSEEEAVTAYEAGLSMKKIADRSGGKYTESNIYTILDQNGVQRRGIGSCGIIHEDYFAIIDTPEKAYLLGFIQADGNIRRNFSQLTISQKDSEQWWILCMIRDFIQPEAKTLNIHNTRICKDLLEKGIVPNKTYDATRENMETLWNSIPYEYKYDFIRGFFDGNGNMRWFYQKETSTTKSCNIGFCSNKYLIDILADFFFEDLGYIVRPQTFEHYSRIAVTDSRIGQELCKRMYRNFKFPYGHSKGIRYFEAFNLPIPVKTDELCLHDFNIILPDGLTGIGLWHWGEAMMKSEVAYKNLIIMGYSPQEARSVLPTSTKTELVMTTNLREWRHFFKLRAIGTTGKPHPQIMEVALPLLRECKEKIPVVFDDLVEKGGETNV